MGLYVMDQRAVARAVFTPDDDMIIMSIKSAGNETHNLMGHDAFGMPIIQCEIKPKDIETHGVRWVNLIVEA